MATIIVRNTLIAVIGVGLVAGAMRFGYLLSGGAFERSPQVAELPASSRDLERAA